MNKTIENNSTMNTSCDHAKVMGEIDAYFNNPFGEVRVINEMEVGQWIRQGDVYLTKIASFNKADYEPTPASSRQIAVGSSKGARHTVSDSVIVWKPKVEGKASHNGVGFEIAGPVIEMKTRETLSHPQHADFSMPEGCYKVSYQVDGQTMMRVLD